MSISKLNIKNKNNQKNPFLNLGLIKWFFNKSTNLIKATFILLIVALSTSTFALNIIPSNSHYYYRLGGGSDISMPPVTKQESISVGGDVNVNLGYSCGTFNPVISMRNSLNQMKDSVEALPQNVIASATAAVGSFPMYILEKASPELYNLLQNAMAHASETFHLSMKSCEDALNNIKDGKSPYQDWFSISDSQGWLKHAKAAQAGNSGEDINDVKKELSSNPEKYGIPWIHHGQNAGGENQVDIQVIRDVVMAGYNVMVDPSLPLDSTTSAPSTSELTHFWKSPLEASKWAQLVLGDVTISSIAGDDKTNAGVGLITILKTCPNGANNDLTCTKNISGSIKHTLINIVQSSGYPTADDLKKVSTNEMMITPDVIASIRNRTPEEQAIAISKLGDDVAIQNLVDESLLLRRLLVAGTQTKPVQNAKPALTAVERVIAELDSDINNLKLESDIRTQFTTSTAQTLLGNENIERAKALSEHEQTQPPYSENGAVYKKTP